MSRKAKFSAGTIVGCMLGCATLLAATVETHDGEFWRSMSSGAKKVYVDGYGDGVDVSLAKIEHLTSAAELFQWKDGKKIIRQLEKDLAMPSGEDEQIVAALDKLYSDSQYNELEIAGALALISAQFNADKARGHAEMIQDKRDSTRSSQGVSSRL